MIQAVIFDIDGTLLDSLESNLAFFQAIMKENGYKPPTLEEYAHLYHKSLEETIQALTGISNPAEVERIWKVGREATLNVQSPLLPFGAEEAVRTLHARYLLAIATNRRREYTYEPPLDQLQRYLKVAVSYEDTENHKPNPEPLLLAAKKLGAKPKQCVYVGDAEVDLVAARAAGMKFVLYGNHTLEGAKWCTPDFLNLPTLIESLDSSRVVQAQ